MDFNTIEPDNLVKMVIERKDMYPILFVGSEYRNAVCRNIKNIVNAKNLEDVRSLNEIYYGVDDIGESVLVLDGIADLSEEGQNSLLKLVEEARFPIILVSLTDRVSKIIMSRMKFIFKRWDPVKIVKQLDVKVAMRNIEEKIKKEKERSKSEGLGIREDLGERTEVDFYSVNCYNAFALKFSSGEVGSQYINKKILWVLLEM